MAVEPMTGRLEDNLNLVGRLYYAGSMIICMPTSLLQEVGAALGAQAGEARLREVIGAGGFQSVRRATQTPLNMLVEARLGTRAFRRLMGGDRPTRGGVGNAPAESPRRLPGTLGGGTGSTPSPSSGESQDQTNASSDDLGRERCPYGGPMVRIHLPPAERWYGAGGEEMAPSSL
jgi:hypothetical protein